MLTSHLCLCFLSSFPGPLSSGLRIVFFWRCLRTTGGCARPYGVHIDESRHDRRYYGELDQLYFQREFHAPLGSQMNWSDQKIPLDGVVRDERSHVSVPGCNQPFRNALANMRFVSTPPQASSDSCDDHLPAPHTSYRVLRTYCHATCSFHPALCVDV